MIIIKKYSFYFIAFLNCIFCLIFLMKLRNFLIKIKSKYIKNYLSKYIYWYIVL